VLGRVMKLIALTSGLVIIFVLLGPLAPVNEALVGYSPKGFVSLAPPVFLSFSAFLALMTFIVLSVLFWGTKREWLNLFIEASGFSFVWLNYLNFYVVYEMWRPEMAVLPFFIEITYHNAGTTVSSLNFDFGQLVLLILAIKYLNEMRSKRRGVGTVDPQQIRGEG